jgi:hypothetical protein
MNIWIYDLETLKNIFTATFLNRGSREIKTFVISKDKDEREPLFKFLNEEVTGLIGFNCLRFDSQILEYLFRYPTATVEDIRNYAMVIIDAGDERFPDVAEWNLKIAHLDLYKIHHFDNKNRRTGLKWCEFSMNMENIEDLPEEEENKNYEQIVLSYNLNDVLATEMLYNHTKPMIELRKTLSKMYNINCLNYSNTKIGSELLLKLYCHKTGKNPKEIKKLRTYRKSIKLSECIFNYIDFKSQIFKEFLKELKKITIKNTKGDLDFCIPYKGTDFYYGTGGIHASLSNKIITSDENYVIIDADVASLYPSIAIVNKMYPQHLGIEFYQVYKHDIVDVRLAEKAKGEWGNKHIVDGFKESANATYGNSNQIHSWLYDPKYTVTTTLNGQLMLTMLAEDLMEIPNLLMIQCNTDGLTVKIHKDNVNMFYQKCKHWETLTKLTLEYAEYKKMIISDVNNYLALYTNGKTKCKGKYEFENIPLHKNKSHSIIPLAIYKYFLHNVPIEDTIRNHTNIFDFCGGVKAKKSIERGQNWYELHSIENGELKIEKLSKTVRYYISNKGKSLIKKSESGHTEYVEAPYSHKKFKKEWKVTYFNKATFPKDFKEYDIDYTYYIVKAKEWATKLEDTQQLSLF